MFQWAKTIFSNGIVKFGVVFAGGMAIGMVGRTNQSQANPTKLRNQEVRTISASVFSNDAKKYHQNNFEIPVYNVYVNGEQVKMQDGDYGKNLRDWTGYIQLEVNGQPLKVCFGVPTMTPDNFKKPE